MAASVRKLECKFYLSREELTNRNYAHPHENANTDSHGKPRMQRSRNDGCDEECDTKADDCRDCHEAHSILSVSEFQTLIVGLTKLQECQDALLSIHRESA